MIKYFTTDEVHIAVTILTIVTVLYECRFGEPITFVFGKPKLFEGTKKQRFYGWAVFIVLIFNLLFMIRI